MNSKRLFILAGIGILGLGSLSVVQYLTTRKITEESGSGYVQNLVEQSEEEEESLQVPQYEETSEYIATPIIWETNPPQIPHADASESIGTYFDLDFDDMRELSNNTVARAQEFDYQYNEELNVDSGLFSESVNLIAYADVDCHKVLLSVLSQYADDHGKDYSVFEMESYYKSMWVEDGLWGNKVLDTTTNETLYIANTSTGFELVGYLYKVE